MAGDTSRQGWHTLVPSLPSYHDPFLALSSEQLAEVGYVVGLRQRIEQRVITDGDGPAIAELRDEQALLAENLAEEGVDVDYLLGERERVMAARRAAATSRSKELLGSRLVLDGYMIPLNKDFSRFYLVENSPLLVIGHDHSAPPPNQVVELTLEQPIEFDAEQRVIVTGTLDKAESQHTVNMPDGHPTELISVYRLNGATVSAHDDQHE